MGNTSSNEDEPEFSLPRSNRTTIDLVDLELDSPSLSSPLSDSPSKRSKHKRMGSFFRSSAKLENEDLPAKEWKCFSFTRGAPVLNALSTATDPKEDRILYINDLFQFFRENNGVYEKFSEKLQIPTSLFQENTEVIGLYGVFDGHIGKFAAEYIQAKLPFQLVLTNEFLVEKNYESALSKAIYQLHESLLNCQEYYPESPKHAFCSGTTASVCLITKTISYFGCIGDSPIIIQMEETPTPYCLFDLHNAENSFDRKRLMKSKMFFVSLNSRKKWDIIVHKKERLIQLKQTNCRVRIGFSGLNLLGSIGDAFYDPSRFNLFLEIIAEYKKQNFEKDLEQLGLNEKDLSSLNSPVEFQKLYSNFRNFVMSCEGWNLLKHCVSLPEKFSEVSPILSQFLFKFIQDKVEYKKLHDFPIRRIPITRSIVNSKIRKILIASDGLIGENLINGHTSQAKMEEILNLTDSTEIFQKLTTFPSANPSDDQSAILIVF